MKFRDDIDPATTWVVSDTHFGHENIIEFCNRPADHEQAMMEHWAQTVPPGDTVLHLGDLSYRNNTFFKRMIAPHLTGARKFLIAGNHDKQRYSFYRESGFKIVRPFQIHYEGTPANQKRKKSFVVSFSHYAWNSVDDGPMPPNAVRIHGHIHNNGYTRAAYVPFLLQHINISVEQTHYRPVNLKALLDGALLGQYPADQWQIDYEAAAIVKNAHVRELEKVRPNHGENDRENIEESV